MEKQDQYKDLLRSVKGLYDKELMVSINQLNVLALLKEKLDLFWVGLYLAKPDKLVLGPYSGSLPCTKIEYGKGLCGETANKGEMQCVNDVSKLDNYIACHPETKAEIVIPGFRDKALAFVLDIDSTTTNAFNETDKHYLTELVEYLASIE